jgi:hypothetical protein
MKSINLVRAEILVAALAVAWLAAGTLTTRAGEITLDVSANVSAVGSQATCGGMLNAPGCTLGGFFVINNTTGAVNFSDDVTFAGESPVVGPFTTGVQLFATGFGTGFPNTFLEIVDSAGNPLFLGLSTPTAGSVVGYDGGTLLPQPPGFFTIYDDANSAVWVLTSGAVTAAAIGTPEPPSYLLLVSALFGAWVLRAYRLKRR